MDDIEERLQRYRPAGPPPALRARVLAGARAPRYSFVLEWLPAAAAVLLTLLFHWMSATEQQLISARVTPLPPFDQAAVRIFEEPQP
jgi:hypothetical protein